MTDKNPQSTPILGQRYQLQQPLAPGGMAVVYKAWDLRLERFVAVKILRQDFTKDPSFRERFRQEARAAANLSHPNIVTVHDFGFDRERLFIVMELVPGTDLKTLMKQRGKFSIYEAIALIVQACQGIGYAHRAGLVHCDVKPHNMLVTPDNRLKVTDFGIARAVAAISPEEKSDIVWGSPQYFSPEQASGLAPSPSSDVYSLGVILYEMLTGQLPFVSDNPTELARMHREVYPPLPRKINPLIPDSLEQILLKVLSKEPTSRYRSADQFGRILPNFSLQARQIANQPASLHTRPPQPQPTQTGVEDRSTQPILPATSPVAAVPTYSPANIENEDDASPAPQKIDWITIGMSLLTLLAVGGLIPFWLFIWFTLNPPP